jgi:hypothetical protein
LHDPVAQKVEKEVCCSFLQARLGVSNGGLRFREVDPLVVSLFVFRGGSAGSSRLDSDTVYHTQARFAGLGSEEWEPAD